MPASMSSCTTTRSSSPQTSPALNAYYVVLLAGRGGRDSAPDDAPIVRHADVASRTLQALIRAYQISSRRGRRRLPLRAFVFRVCNRSLRRHGAWRGGWMALKRLARCHPWGRLLRSRR